MGQKFRTETHDRIAEIQNSIMFLYFCPVFLEIERASINYKRSTQLLGLHPTTRASLN